MAGNYLYVISLYWPYSNCRRKDGSEGLMTGRHREYSWPTLDLQLQLPIAQKRTTHNIIGPERMSVAMHNNHATNVICFQTNITCVIINITIQ